MSKELILMSNRQEGQQVSTCVICNETFEHPIIPREHLNLIYEFASAEQKRLKDLQIFCVTLGFEESDLGSRTQWHDFCRSCTTDIANVSKLVSARKGMDDGINEAHKTISKLQQDLQHTNASIDKIVQNIKSKAGISALSDEVRRELTPSSFQNQKPIYQAKNNIVNLRYPLAANPITTSTSTRFSLSSSQLINDNDESQENLDSEEDPLLLPLPKANHSKYETRSTKTIKPKSCFLLHTKPWLKNLSNQDLNQISNHKLEKYIEVRLFRCDDNLKIPTTRLHIEDSSNSERMKAMPSIVSPVINSTKPVSIVSKTTSVITEVDLNSILRGSETQTRLLQNDIVNETLKRICPVKPVQSIIETQDDTILFKPPSKSLNLNIVETIDLEEPPERMRLNNSGVKKIKNTKSEQSQTYDPDYKPSPYANKALGRKRGRPKSKCYEELANSLTLNSQTTSSSGTSDSGLTKKARGRPRNYAKKKILIGKKKLPETSNCIQPRRGPGRPRKTDIQSCVVELQESTLPERITALNTILNLDDPIKVENSEIDIDDNCDMQISISQTRSLIESTDQEEEVISNFVKSFQSAKSPPRKVINTAVNDNEDVTNVPEYFDIVPASSGPIIFQESTEPLISELLVGFVPESESYISEISDDTKSTHSVPPCRIVTVKSVKEESI